MSSHIHLIWKLFQLVQRSIFQSMTWNSTPTFSVRAWLQAVGLSQVRLDWLELAAQRCSFTRSSLMNIHCFRCLLEATFLKYSEQLHVLIWHDLSHLEWKKKNQNSSSGKYLGSSVWRNEEHISPFWEKATFSVAIWTILVCCTNQETKTKVIIEKSRGEVSLMGQDTIENVS